jgi:hypothetical protein
MFSSARPPSAFGSRPCLMAFSTRLCCIFEARRRAAMTDHGGTVAKAYIERLKACVTRLAVRCRDLYSHGILLLACVMQVRGQRPVGHVPSRRRSSS